MIRVQQEDFSIQDEYLALKKASITGAVVTFIGTVRDFRSDNKSFYLEHYPGMTETVLADIEQTAQARWDLINTSIIHRVGHLGVDDQIVFVGVSSAHREDAFSACQYIMDILKTEAPFWKKEGNRWVSANLDDNDKAQRWLK